MRIEVNYQGRTNPKLNEEIRILMKKINAKQFSHGSRKDETYIWFDYQEDNQRQNVN